MNIHQRTHFVVEIDVNVVFLYLAWKGLSVFARTSASHLRVVPGGTVDRMTRIGARPEDCSISFTTRGMVDHTYCREGGVDEHERVKEKNVNVLYTAVTCSLHVLNQA